jgi:hypothetical protein
MWETANIVHANTPRTRVTLALATPNAFQPTWVSLKAGGIPLQW